MEQFIATVRTARKGFDLKRTIDQIEAERIFSKLHYDNDIQSLTEIAEFVNEVYKELHQQAFKIQFNF
ncbi:MAG: hypothetical protein EZS28_005589 [Streblomastix strix]|uniref:Uncharacterized protein n=1 Tax=Streblomastix strix TaxID=222440 RepID=A0A5J4WVF1_9EUKA|nr:MAG: hypothetical protein EZS28_005589 [Streblomastix strix]